MVTFDSTTPGTSAEEWSFDPRWSRLPRLTLSGTSHILVLAAHPDDETLGAGGLIASARATGVPVTLIVATDGSGAGSVDDQESLARVRAEEAISAGQALGLEDIRFLGIEDGLVRENRESVASAVADVAAEFPNALVVAPWRGDGHRDHRVLGEIASAVCAEGRRHLWAYPIWLWHWGTPERRDVPWHAMASLPLEPGAVAAKSVAIRTYRSQTSGPKPVLHERFLAHFRRREEVFVVDEQNAP
jgi:LmbE family N-acetylglucosaminyl deacetylase